MYQPTGAKIDSGKGFSSPREYPLILDITHPNVLDQINSEEFLLLQAAPM